MINLFAEVTAKNGCETELYKTLSEMITPSRAEPGCCEYHITQSNEDPAIFLTYEVFLTMEDVESHVASGHYQNLLKKAENIIAEPPKVRFCTEIEIES